MLSPHSAQITRVLQAFREKILAILNAAGGGSPHLLPDLYDLVADQFEVN